MHDDAKPGDPTIVRGDGPSPGVLFRGWLLLELVALYWVVPGVLDLTDTIDAPAWLAGPNATVGRMLMPVLGFVGIALFFWLYASKKFPNRSLWNWPAFMKEFRRILITAGVAFFVMLGLAWWFTKTSWAPAQVEPLALLKRNWVLLVAICFLYPIFSVYPQEIILRTFFFHRYKPLFGKGGLMLTVNALTFAWVHVIFQNWVAVLLCVPAGFLFGYTYMKTKSTLASGVEHAIVGNLMWLSGIGWFFFGGAVGAGNAEEGTFNDAGGQTYTYVLEGVSRFEDEPPAVAALLLGGGSVLDESWTIPPSVALDPDGADGPRSEITVPLTIGGEPTRDAAALASAIARQGGGVLRFSTIHTGDTAGLENPQLAEPQRYEDVRALCRRALTLMRRRLDDLRPDAQSTVPTALVGHSLGGARALQIAATDGRIDAVVLLAPAYVSPLDSSPADAVEDARLRAAALGIELPAVANAITARREELGAAFGIAENTPLDFDGDGSVRAWELAGLAAVARFDREGWPDLASLEIRGEAHPAAALASGLDDARVLAVFGSLDLLSIHAPIVAAMVQRAGLRNVEVRIEPGLGHNLSPEMANTGDAATIVDRRVGPIDTDVVNRIASWLAL